jgi:RNA polymerase sigma-70 factor (ECF subfamily)
MTGSASGARTELATRLLDELAGGDPSAADRLLPLVYDELRALAAARLAQERAGHTLQPTALAHEAYLKLVDQSRVQWRGREHFLAVASTFIRRILVDHARSYKAAKRGAGHRVGLDASETLVPAEDGVDLIDVDEALIELARLSERQARVVELRFFAGLDVAQTAAVLDVAERTVKGDWAVARAWLRRRLER